MSKSEPIGDPLHLLAVHLKPKQITDLIKMINEHYMQPFQVISVTPELGNKKVVIQLRSGIRKTYLILPSGHMHRRSQNG